MIRIIVTIVTATAVLFSTAVASTCGGRFAVEILGSGGPLADDPRASSGYLVWIDGEAKVIVDLGGGIFLRFAETGASVQSLDAVLISHFHADHVADLPALLKSGSFESRDRPLTVVGPSKNQFFPGLYEFLRATFDKDNGAYRYLSGYLDSQQNWPALTTVEVDAFADKTENILVSDDVQIEAIPVNHGAVPALAYKVTADGASVVFAGDQSLLSNYFDESLAGSAPFLLVAHHAISGAKGQPRGLHRDPGSIGEMASSMKAQKLVLSHNMKRALDGLDDGLRAINAIYDGPVEVAEDHACYLVTP